MVGDSRNDMSRGINDYTRWFHDTYDSPSIIDLSYPQVGCIGSRMGISSIIRTFVLDDIMIGVS